MIGLLTILLFICHFLADFTSLSTVWMLEAKRFGRPLFPIFVHASVHAILMLGVLLFFTNPLMAFQLALIQLCAHFLIDTWKGRMSFWFPILQDNAKRGYWTLMGFDQFLHQLTIVGMVVLLWKGERI